MNRAGGTVLLLGMASACGGETVGSRSETSPDVDGAAVLTPCDSPRRAPRFAVAPLCSTFIPAISGLRPFVLMARDRLDDGTVEHLLRAPADAFDCGFDVTMWLDGIDFGTVGDEYVGGGWWIMGTDPLNVLTLVLRVGEDVAFAAATEGSTGLLVNVDPYDVSPAGSACEDGVEAVVLRRGGTALSCEPDPADPTVELCGAGDEGERTFRLVRHFVGPGEPAAIFGDAALLASTPRSARDVAAR